MDDTAIKPGDVRRVIRPYVEYHVGDKLIVGPVSRKGNPRVFEVYRTDGTHEPCGISWLTEFTEAI